MITDSPIAIWKSNGKDAWNGDAVKPYNKDGSKICTYPIGRNTKCLTRWATNFKKKAVNIDHPIKESLFFHKIDNNWHCLGSIFEIHEIDLVNNVRLGFASAINNRAWHQRGVCNIQKTWQTTFFN
jgi:hypothetical protein